MKTSWFIRTASGVIFVLGLLGTAGFSSQDESGEAEAKPCRATKFETPEVEKACKDGGQTAARALMKEVEAFTKSKGEVIKCKGCHSDLKTYELSAKGASDLRKILAEMKKPAPAPAKKKS